MQPAWRWQFLACLVVAAALIQGAAAVARQPVLLRGAPDDGVRLGRLLQQNSDKLSVKFRNGTHEGEQRLVGQIRQPWQQWRQVTLLPRGGWCQQLAPRPRPPLTGLLLPSCRWPDFLPPGYPLETHKVYTEDGWVLRLYRIPHGGQRNTKPGPRPVVLLWHGFSLSSLSFALWRQNESLAYILADAGARSAAACAGLLADARATAAWAHSCERACPAERQRLWHSASSCRLLCGQQQQ